MNNDHNDIDENEAAAAAILGENFMEVDFLEFDGRELNTSPSRFDLVTRWAMPELLATNASAASVYPIAKKTVFVCQLGPKEFRLLRRDDDALEDAFDEWNDKRNLVPANKSAMQKLIDVSNEIWESWNGSAAEPEERAGGSAEEPGKREPRP